MEKVDIVSQLWVSYSGTALALISAGLLWAIKSAFQKHQKEITALARYEREFIYNFRYLKDNLEFLGSWIELVKQSRAYSVKFSEYFINNEETYQLSDTKLIGLILEVNYKLNRMNIDLKNVYDGYWDTLRNIDGLEDLERKERNLRVFNSNTLKTLITMHENYPSIEEKIIELVANIRVRYHIRSHSLFGYLSYLFKDIYPRVTKESVDKKVDELRKNISSLA